MALTMSTEKDEDVLELFSNASDKKLKTIESPVTEEDTGTSSIRKHISIKIRQQDLDALKKEAERRGLRYQSLINSILHQYVTGRLKST